MEEWDGLCPECGNSRFYNTYNNIYECKDCGCRIVDENSNLASAIMQVTEEVKNKEGD